jgi:FixJ family two-component response regulator
MTADSREPKNSNSLSTNVMTATSGDPNTRRQVDAFVVDDEEGICKFIATALASCDLQSESYCSAEQVIAALERERPSIIFLDIALKGSDAIDVIRKLALERFTGIIQLMSGGQQSLMEDVFRIGSRHGLNMRPPLQKPIRLETIHRVVSQAGEAAQ